MFFLETEGIGWTNGDPAAHCFVQRVSNNGFTAYVDHN